MLLGKPYEFTCNCQVVMTNFILSVFLLNINGKRQFRKYHTKVIKKSYSAMQNETWQQEFSCPKDVQRLTDWVN